MREQKKRQCTCSFMTTWKILKEVSWTSWCCNNSTISNYCIVVCARTLETESNSEDGDFSQGNVS